MSVAADPWPCGQIQLLPAALAGWLVDHDLMPRHCAGGTALLLLLKLLLLAWYSSVVETRRAVAAAVATTLVWEVLCDAAAHRRTKPDMRVLRLFGQTAMVGSRRGSGKKPAF